MPVSEIMAGAFVGLAIQLLHDAIKRAKERSKATRFILDRLNATILRITPLVVQVDKLSEEVENSQRKVIEDFKHLLENAASLVESYAELRRRDLLKKYRYKKRIIEFEASLRLMIDVDVTVSQWLDIKELMTTMLEMNTKLDEIMRQPSDRPIFIMNRRISQSTTQNIVEEIQRSSDDNDECLSAGSKPKIDIHIQLSSRKRNKDHEIRFTLK